MVVAVVEQDVVGRARALVGRSQHAEIAQQVERAVDGHAADAGLSRAHEVGQFVGRHVAAGLDVWYSYPPDAAARADWPPSACPFRELDNVVMSPHRGGAADETPRLRMTALAEMLNAAAAGGKMGNVVDVGAGY